MNQPVTVEALRDEIADAPYLTAFQAEALGALPDGELDTTLEMCFRQYEDMWFTILDSTRTAAIQHLLSEHDLGDMI